QLYREDQPINGASSLRQIRSPRQGTTKRRRIFAQALQVEHLEPLRQERQQRFGRVPRVEELRVRIQALRDAVKRGAFEQREPSPQEVWGCRPPLRRHPTTEHEV